MYKPFTSIDEQVPGRVIFRDKAGHGPVRKSHLSGLPEGGFCAFGGSSCTSPSHP